MQFLRPSSKLAKELEFVCWNSSTNQQFRTSKLSDFLGKHHLEMQSAILTIISKSFTEKPTPFCSVSKNDLKESFLIENIVPPKHRWDTYKVILSTCQQTLPERLQITSFGVKLNRIFFWKKCFPSKRFTGHVERTFVKTAEKFNSISKND